MSFRITNGQVADELIQGNWQILNEVLDYTAQNMEREAAIRSIHFGWIYFAGYYIGSNGYQRIIDSVHGWDKHVGFTA